MAQIICDNVSLGYSGKSVCEGVSFRVETGDFLCIVGDNGSRKSTLVKALLHLNDPLNGEIVFSDGVRRNDIGYLPQRTEAQADFPATVCEIVRSGCVANKGASPFFGKKQRERAQRNMKCMRISDLANKPFSELSGGQQQRVLLARALCAAEKILLLDEPISGLDPTATKETYAAIRHLNRDHGTTIRMVTHDMRAVSEYATKVLCMGETPTFYESAASYCEEVGILFKDEEEWGNA